MAGLSSANSLLSSSTSKSGFSKTALNLGSANKLALFFLVPSCSSSLDPSSDPCPSSCPAPSVLASLRARLRCSSASSLSWTLRSRSASFWLTRTSSLRARIRLSARLASLSASSRSRYSS